MMMKPHPDVNEDDQHQLTVNINNVGLQTAVIIVGGPAPLPVTIFIPGINSLISTELQ